MRAILCFLVMTACQSDTKFKPERIQQSAVITLNATVDDVFPLFGPVREMDWAHGWNPEVIYPADAQVGEDMIFETQAHHGERYLWSIPRYDSGAHLVKYCVAATGRIWFITVTCRSRGERTDAMVTYQYTGLSDDGNKKNRAALQSMFAQQLKDWEEAINYYLKTGKQLLPDQ